MALFVGEFDQMLDEKRRLAVPAALRDQIDPQTDGEGFFLVLGSDRHLWLYPDRYYKDLMSSLKRSPLPTRSGRKMSLLFAMARQLKPDKQGRVVLPDKSLRRADVETEVTLVGHDDHIEIWPRKQWEAFIAEHLPTYGETLLEMGDALSSEGPEPV
ncbi:MAG: division/cell wall cluster transcriptional repressor MraZ [Planctomycetota bacterium]